jgi:hypothetical protein
MFLSSCHCDLAEASLVRLNVPLTRAAAGAALTLDHADWGRVGCTFRPWMPTFSFASLLADYPEMQIVNVAL